jgi:hypothetical protein
MEQDEMLEGKEEGRVLNLIQHLRLNKIKQLTKVKLGGIK